jgi:molybdopterin-containing oxidoreductase family iron-sulfur binding subunit
MVGEGPGTEAPQAPATPREGVSRRSFLAGLAVAGAAIASGPGLRTVLAADDLSSVRASNGDPDDQWVMVFDLRLCDGCRDCTKGCQGEHHLDEDIEWIKVYELRDSIGRSYPFPVLCMQCRNAPCTRACPVGATYHTADGVVVVDQDICIGCRMCMAACPYDVRVFNWRDQHDVPVEHHDDRPEFTVPQTKGTVGKCALCVHDLREGAYPACLESCSMGAIYVGNLASDAATNRRETVILSDFLIDNDAFRFREELGTEPRVYYIAGHGQDLEY